MQASVKNRIEETRNVDMNPGIPRGVIQSLNNTIVGGAPSIGVEQLNRQLYHLTQASYTDQARSEDLRSEFINLSCNYNLEDELGRG